jgi:hypothetical protein
VSLSESNFNPGLQDLWTGWWIAARLFLYQADSGSSGFVGAGGGHGVLQHLKATTRGQPPFTMTKVKQGAAYNYKVFAIEEASKVSAVASIKGRTGFAFLPLLLDN